MSLRYALLSLLLDCDATGYDLAKQFDASVANFWHALPQQLYQELARMEDDGLVSGEEVVQAARPNKRVFSVTTAGRAALSGWIDEPADIRSIKDELLVKIYGADLKAPTEIAAVLAASLAPHTEKLASYEAVAKFLLGAQGEAEYLRTTPRIGPYLTLKRGMMYERENIAWAEWAITAMAGRSRSPAETGRVDAKRPTARVSPTRPTPARALRSPRRRSAKAQPGD
jgi:DNA-binding PadR family transcriptional regulator